MARPSEKDEIRRLEEKNIQDKLEETFRTNGWKDIILPMCEEIYVQNLEDSMQETDVGKNARAMIKSLKVVFDKIGIKINAGEKAKEYLAKKIKGE